MPIKRFNLNRLVPTMFRSNTTDRAYTLFSGGAQGAVHDFPDRSTLLGDSAGSVDVTAAEQAVGRAIDKSGQGNHLLQAAAASRPMLGARVNLLVATGTIGDASWASGPNLTIGAIEGTINGVPARRVTSNVAGNSYISQTLAVMANASYTVRCLADSGVLGPSYVQMQPSARNITPVVTQLSPGVWEYLYSVTVAATGETSIWVLMPGVDQAPTTTWRVASPQVEQNATATRYQRVNTATDYDTAGFPHYLTFDGSNDYLSSPTGGGGTAGFFFCGAVEVNAAKDQAVFQDAGANCGYLIRITSTNAVVLFAGNGTDFTSAISVDSIPVNTKKLITAWDDGVNLNIQIDDGAVVSVAHPPIFPGSAGFSIGTCFGAEYLSGRIYPYVYFRGSAGTAAQRAVAKAWARGRTAYMAVPAGSVAPVPLNNLVALVGDSRTSINSVDTNAVAMNSTVAYGYAAWIEAVCGYRAKIVGNYGVNANTLDQMITRLTSVETRGQILNSPASVFVFLGGVNNTTEVIATVGPKYQSLINQLTAAGKLCIVMNEMPNSDQSTQGPVHFGRRQYLDGAVYTNDGQVIRFNSYDLMALSPTSYFPKAGYYGDALHPTLKGNREIGKGIGALLNQIFASFPVRNGLATVKSATNMMFNGVAGALGTGATGSMATDWNGDAIPAGLTVAYSKGVDPDGYEQQIITISGTPTAAAPTFAQWMLNCYSIAGTSFVSGNAIQHGVRCIIDAGNTGLVGVEPVFAANDNTNSVYLRAESFTTNIYDNASTTTATWLAGDMKGEAFDHVILSPQITLGTGWTASASKSVNPRVGITFRGGSAVNAVIKLSRSTLLVNT